MTDKDKLRAEIEERIVELDTERLRIIADKGLMMKPSRLWPTSVVELKREINILQRCLDQLPRWVPTKERLPEVGDMIVAAHKYEDDSYTAQCCTYYDFGFPTTLWNVKSPVTYWYLLPPLPTKGEHK